MLNKIMRWLIGVDTKYEIEKLWIVANRLTGEVDKIQKQLKTEKVKK